MDNRNIESYSGSRNAFSCNSCKTGSGAFCRCSNVVVYYDNHTRQQLHHFLEFVNHSPTGFEWGYSGSGPSQLAFAMLMDFTHDKELALDLYQQFKIDFISQICDDQWEIKSIKIREWIGRFYSLKE